MNTLNNILVVKIGGGAGLDRDAVIADLAQIAQTRPVVVVHGVSEHMAELSAEREMPVQMLQSPSGHSSRYTPPPVRDLFVEAATDVNDAIVAQLRQHGLVARGALDPVLIAGTRKKALRALVDGRMRVVRDDYTGSIDSVNAEPIMRSLLEQMLVVVPPMADSADGLLNIDGDRAAAAVAGAIGAAEMLILSNVRGLYRDFSNPDSLVREVATTQLDSAMDWAEGRMKRKVLSAQEALRASVQRVIIADGRVENPVAQALNGAGTVFAQ